MEYTGLSDKEMLLKVEELEKEMYQLARDLQFEKAADLRDEINVLKRDFLKMPTSAGV